MRSCRRRLTKQTGVANNRADNGTNWCFRTNGKDCHIGYGRSSDNRRLSLFATIYRQ